MRCVVKGKEFVYKIILGVNVECGSNVKEIREEHRKEIEAQLQRYAENFPLRVL